MSLFLRFRNFLPPAVCRLVHTVSAPPELRHYQQECITACLDALKTGKRRIAVSLATGGGKTVIFANLLNQIEPKKTGNKVLVLTHRKELATQAQSQIGRFNRDLKVGIEMGKEKADPDSDVVVAGVQTIRGKRLEQWNPCDFKAIIIDEAHHAASNSYLRILEYFDATEPESNVAVVGFTATLFRTDTKSLSKAFDHVVYDLSFMDMISDGWLSSVKFSTVASLADLTQVKVGTSGDFLTASLSKAVNTDATNNLVFKTWQNMTRKHGYKSTLGFCVDVQHVKDLTAFFQAQGVNAEGCTGTTKPKTREKIIDEFKNSEIPVLFNCGVFTEGTDIPNIDLVILNRPTRSKGLMMQMIGRGLRLHPGKDHTAVVDLVGTVTPGLVTAPSLLGLPADHRCHGASFRDLLKAKKEVKLPEKIRITTFNSLQDFFDLGRKMKEKKKEEEYGERFANPANWMQLTPTIWALEKSEHGHRMILRIVPDPVRAAVEATLVIRGYYNSYYGLLDTPVKGKFASKKKAFDAVAKYLEQSEYASEIKIWDPPEHSIPASQDQKNLLRELVFRSQYMLQSVDVVVLTKKKQKALETKTPVHLTEDEFQRLRAQELLSFVDNIDSSNATLWIQRLFTADGELSRIYKKSNLAKAEKAYRRMIDPAGDLRAKADKLADNQTTEDFKSLVGAKLGKRRSWNGSIEA